MYNDNKIVLKYKNIVNNYCWFYHLIIVIIYYIEWFHDQF